MLRALLPICLLALSASSAVAQPKKEKIAILGLEVSGSIEQEATAVALQLTVELRKQAKLNKGPFTLADKSEKEALDEKFSNSCENEAKSCMATIGKNLGADYLLWGKIEKQSQGQVSGYKVSLSLLKVKEGPVPDTFRPSHFGFIPLAESKDARVGDWARKFYKALTGYNDGGLLVVKVSNVDRGTILVENEERGNINSGRGEVPDLPAGRYRVAVVAEGFQRWESADKVTIKNGETTPIDATLTPLGDNPLKFCDPSKSTCEGAPGDPKGGGSKVLWKAMLVGGVLIALGSGGYNLLKLQKDKKGYEDTDCSNVLPGDNTTPCRDPKDMRPFPEIDQDGRDVQSLQNKVWLITGAGIVIAAIGVAGTFVIGGSKEKQAAGSTTVGKVSFTPIIGPDGAGATIRLDW